MSLIPLGIIAAAKAAYAWLFYSTPTTSTTYYRIAYAPLTAGNFYTNDAGSNNSTYYYSSNGTSWTSGTMPSSISNRIYVGSPSRIIAVLQNTTTNGCMYSTNGTTWTLSNLSTSAAIQQGLWDGTRFLLVSSTTTSGGLMHSTTGATWASIDVGNGGYDIKFDGTSRYVVMSATSTATHRTCTSDPTVTGNWSDITLPSSASWRTVAYGNGIWVALQDGTRSYATSTNGTTWTSRTLPTNRTNSQQNDSRMVFANGYFYYITDPAGVDLDTYLMKSSDGINWTDEKTWKGGFSAAISWAVASNKIIAAGQGTTTGEFLIGA